MVLFSALPRVGACVLGVPALVARFPFLPVLKQAILTARPRPALVNYNQFSLAISSSLLLALA